MSLKLRLIDYDGMWVPVLAGQQSTELGHLCYQHPQRLREGLFNADVNRFSHLAIYTAIRCVMVGRGKLWQRFHNGENLLFTQEDYRRPEESEAFRACWQLEHAEAQALVGRLVLACRRPLAETPPLEQVLLEERAVSLSGAERQEVEAILAESPWISLAPVARPEVAPQADGGRAQPIPEAIPAETLDVLDEPLLAEPFEVFDAGGKPPQLR